MAKKGSEIILGIDVGGSGIKAAPVDIATGQMTTDRFRLETPLPATPGKVAKVIEEITRHFKWDERMGCGFPGVVRNGITYTAANIHEEWVGVNAAELLSQKTGCQTRVINDADAAGLAEMRFGAGRDYQRGVVLMLTLGTGIGSAVFTNGILVPNTEFGHMELDGKQLEKRASAAVRDRKHLSWQEWGERVNRALGYLEFLLSPELIIVGGGVSKDYEKFFPFLNLKTRVVPARLRNQAGVIGAALAWTLD